MSSEQLRPLYVIGSSGLAREVAQLAMQINRLTPTWQLKGFIAASKEEIGLDLGYAAVVGDDAWLLESDIRADLVLGVGRPMLRGQIVAPYLRQPERFLFPNLIHPTATVDLDRVTLGRGNTIGAGCVFTCDITIGDFNHLNLLCTLGHDTRLGDCNVINPGSNLSGGTTLGDNILVGTGAQILEGIEVASNAVVGAGAVVVKPVEAGTTVVGVPAKVLAPRE